MPFLRKKRYSKKRSAVKRPRRVYRKSRVARRPRRALSSNYSRIHEEYDVTANANTTYAHVTQLSSLVRAKQIAPFFQEYKITSVKLIFKPKWDTYPVDLANGQQLPYFLFVNDPASTVPNNIAYQDYISMGAKPVRFDDRSITRYMPPCVIMNSPVTSTTVLPALIKKSPWLPTSSTNGGPWSINDVVHHGLKALITGVTPADTSQYVVTVGVTVLFRKPLININPASQM